MSFTIGRASLPVDPSSARWSGDQLTITGWISPTTANDTNHAYALRQQLLGLVNNPDEQVFPCTFSVDPNWDGYYYVNSVNIAGDPGLMEIQGRMPYSIQLTRLPGGFKRPRIETVVTRALRTNAHGVATPATIAYALQNGNTATVENDLGLWTGLVTNSTLASDTGSWPISVGEYSFAAGTRAYTTTLPPANYYDAACKIELLYGGATYYAAAGNQIPVDVTTNTWRMTNGNVRVYPTYNTVSRHVELTIESYNGTAWNGTVFAYGNGASGTWTARGLIGAGSGIAQTSPWYLRIIKNTPWTTVIRIDYVQYTTYLTLLRGHPYVIVKIVENNSTATVKPGWKATAPGAPASAAFTGGAHATADDTNSRRWQIVTPVANTVAAPALYTTAVTTTSYWQLCPDWQTELTAATGATMRDYFLCAVNFAQSVVPR